MQQALFVAILVVGCAIPPLEVQAAPVRITFSGDGRPERDSSPRFHRFEVGKTKLSLDERRLQNDINATLIMENIKREATIQVVTGQFSLMWLRNLSMGNLEDIQRQVSHFTGNVTEKFRFGVEQALSYLFEHHEGHVSLERPFDDPEYLSQSLDSYNDYLTDMDMLTLRHNREKRSRFFSWVKRHQRFKARGYRYKGRKSGHGWAKQKDTYARKSNVAQIRTLRMPGQAAIKIPFRGSMPVVAAGQNFLRTNIRPPVGSTSRKLGHGRGNRASNKPDFDDDRLNKRDKTIHQSKRNEKKDRRLAKTEGRSRAESPHFVKEEGTGRLRPVVDLVTNKKVFSNPCIKRRRRRRGLGDSLKACNLWKKKNPELAQEMERLRTQRGTLSEADLQRARSSAELSDRVNQLFPKTQSSTGSRTSGSSNSFKSADGKFTHFFYIKIFTFSKFP